MLIVNKPSQQCLKNDLGYEVEAFTATSIIAFSLTIELN